MADTVESSEKRDRDALVRTAVAATLRQVADWGPMTPDELADIASAVERLERGDMICPMCEEMTCDVGCALVSVRDWGA